MLTEHVRADVVRVNDGVNDHEVLLGVCSAFSVKAVRLQEADTADKIVVRVRGLCVLLLKAAEVLYRFRLRLIVFDVELVCCPDSSGLGLVVERPVTEPTRRIHRSDASGRTAVAVATVPAIAVGVAAVAAAAVAAIATEAAS